MFKVSVNKLKLSEIKCKNGQCPKDTEGIFLIKTVGKENILISCFCAEHEKEVEDIIKKTMKKYE